MNFLICNTVKEKRWQLYIPSSTRKVIFLLYLISLFSFLPDQALSGEVVQQSTPGKMLATGTFPHDALKKNPRKCPKTFKPRIYNVVSIGKYSKNMTFLVLYGMYNRHLFSYTGLQIKILPKKNLRQRKIVLRNILENDKRKTHARQLVVYKKFKPSQN